MPTPQISAVSPRRDIDGSDPRPIWAQARSLLASALEGAATTQVSLDGPMIDAAHAWLEKLSHGKTLLEAERTELKRIGKFLFWRHADDVPRVVGIWASRPRSGLVFRRQGRGFTLRAIGATHLQPLTIRAQRTRAPSPGATKAAKLADDLRNAPAPTDNEVIEIPAAHDWLDAFANAAGGAGLIPPVAEAPEALLAEEIEPWIEAAMLPDDLAERIRTMVATLHELARDSEAVQAVGLPVAPAAFGRAGEAVPDDVAVEVGGDGGEVLVGHQGSDSLASGASGGLAPGFDLTAPVGPNTPNHIHDVALVQALLAFTPVPTVAAPVYKKPGRNIRKPLWPGVIDGVAEEDLFYSIAIFNYGQDRSEPSKQRKQLKLGRWRGDHRATITPGAQMAALRAAATKFGNDLRAIHGSRTVYAVEDTRWGDRSIGQVRGLFPEARKRLYEAQRLFNQRFGLNLLAHRIPISPTGTILPKPTLSVEARVLFLHPSDIEFQRSGLWHRHLIDIDPDAAALMMKERTKALLEADFEASDASFDVTSDIEIFLPPPPDTFGLIVIASVTRLVGNAFRGLAYIYLAQADFYSSLDTNFSELDSKLKSNFKRPGSNIDKKIDEFFRNQLNSSINPLGDPVGIIAFETLGNTFEILGKLLLNKAEIWFSEARMDGRLNVNNISVLTEGAIELIPWVGQGVSVLATIGEKQSFTEGVIEFGIKRLSNIIGDWLGRLTGHLVSKAGQTDELIDAALKQTKRAAKEQNLPLDELSDQVFVDSVKTPAGWVTEKIVNNLSSSLIQELLIREIEKSRANPPRSRGQMGRNHKLSRSAAQRSDNAKQGR